MIRVIEVTKCTQGSSFEANLGVQLVVTPEWLMGAAYYCLKWTEGDGGCRVGECEWVGHRQ